MTNILTVNSSPKTEGSISRDLVERFVEHPGPDPPPHRLGAKIDQPGREIGVVGGSRRSGLMGNGRPGHGGKLDHDGGQDQGEFQDRMARHAGPFGEV